MEGKESEKQILEHCSVKCTSWAHLEPFFFSQMKQSIYYRLMLPQVKEAVEGLVKDCGVGQVLERHAFQAVKLIGKNLHPIDALHHALDALIDVLLQRRVDHRVGTVDHHDD